MSKEGEKWHRDINIIINKMKSSIGEIKLQHRDILKKHLYVIKQIPSLIKQTFLAFTKIEKYTDMSPIIEYSSEIREFRKLPPKVRTFIQKPIDSDKLYSFFGLITLISTATEKKVLSLTQNFSFRKQLDEPEPDATIQTGY